nr:zinc finger, CCHC-type [Tanacetum cinerariifolium]
YFGTYAPVACISTIRLLIALAATHNPVIHQMVVKTIFLNGDLEEEMYMKQPEGIVMPCNKHKGIDCIFIGYVEHSKAYRLHVIEPNDFVSVNSIIESKDVIFDENKFSLIPRSKDIVSSSSGTQGEDLPRETPIEIPKPQRIDDEIGSIMENNTWVLSDLPPSCNPLRQKEGIDYFGTYAPVACISTIRLLIALAATHNPVIHQMVVKTIFLNGDLEEEMYMKQPEGIVMPCCGLVSTSMEASIKLMPHMGKPVTQLEYSRAIECLMYAMTSTRPNITYAIEKLSRFTSNPSNHHWEAIIKVFMYLKKIMNYGLSYVGFSLVIEGYFDASSITNSEDQTSTNDWVFLLGGSVIS